MPASVELVRAALDLARTQGHLLYPAIHLAAYTGMRSGEALALTWDKVDLAAGRLIIDATLGRTLDKGLLVEPPKAESGRRVVDWFPRTHGDRP